MTLDHLPDTVAKSQAPFVTMMRQLLPSNQPTWLIYITCLAPLGTGMPGPALTVLQNQLLRAVLEDEDRYSTFEPFHCLPLGGSRCAPEQDRG